MMDNEIRAVYWGKPGRVLGVRDDTLVHLTRDRDKTLCGLSIGKAKDSEVEYCRIDHANCPKCTKLSASNPRSVDIFDES